MSGGSGGDVLVIAVCFGMLGLLLLFQLYCGFGMCGSGHIVH
jgi:hypothetical protein